MTSTQSLYESYHSVYNDELRQAITEEMDLFEDIDELFDDELDEVVDEAIEDMLDEGYSIEDIELAFDDILTEATVTTGRGGYTKLSSDKRNAPVTTGRGTELKNQSRRDSVVAQARQRQAQAIKDAPGKAVSRVKDAIGRGINKARKAVDRAAGDYAAKNKLVYGKTGKALNRTSIGMKQNSNDPAGRRGVRSAVVGHLAGRAANKLQRGVDKVGKTVQKAGQRAVDATKSASDNAQSSMRAGGEKAKTKGKSFLGRVARKVASGASKFASRLGEDVDVYDVVLEHLLDEGYADSQEDAEKIMISMSQDWFDSIISE